VGPDTEVEIHPPDQPAEPFEPLHELFEVTCSQLLRNLLSTLNLRGYLERFNL
jgi:hypothetical protein